MLKKLLVVAGVGLGLLLLAWLGLLAWANSGRLEAELEAQLSRETGLTIELTGFALGPLLGAEAAELVVRDPAGGPFLALAKVALAWGLPWGEGPLVRAHAGGGRVELRREAWEHWRPGPARPVPGPAAGPPGLPRLGREGRMEQGDAALASLGWRELEGRLVSALHGIDLPFTEGRGRLTLWRSGRVKLEEAGMAAGPAVPLEVAMDGLGERLQVDLRLAPPRLGEFMALPPWGIQAMALGLAGEGALLVTARFELQKGELAAVEGRVEATRAALRLGGERVLGPLDGSWSFSGDASGVGGEVELAALELAVMGLPLRFQGLGGRFEVGGQRARLARARAASGLGPVRLAWQASWAESAPGWELVVEAGGPGHWLQAGTLLASPAGVALKGVRVGLPVVALELAGVLSPLELRPPTWELGEGAVRGSLPAAGAIAWEGLTGKFYLDAQGGYSFRTAGAGGELLGQLVADGGLRLWATPAGGAQEVLGWPPPTRD